MSNQDEVNLESLATPVLRFNGQTLHYELAGGLTKREWFAGMALQGMMMRTDAIGMAKAETLASWAYQQADAMIARQEV